MNRINREMRRKLKKNASQVANEFSRAIVMAGPGGRAARRITDATAQAAIRAAAMAVLRNGGQPVVQRIGLDAARAMPIGRAPIDNADAWLAAGLDLDRQLAVRVRWAPRDCREGPNCEKWRAEMLAELAVLSAVPGLPLEPAGAA
jgi:hypothetical protein